MERIHAALEAGFESVKLNVVVMKGVNDDELVSFADLAKRLAIHVRFLEFMPFDDNGWAESEVVSYQQMLGAIEPFYRLTPIELDPNAVAKEFWVDGGPGVIGFVTSMTDPFCQGCNRLRLTADGKMKNCLFSTGEVDLRDRMRAGATDEELCETMAGNVLTKWAGHPGMAQLPQLANRAMISIGG